MTKRLLVMGADNIVVNAIVVQDGYTPRDGLEYIDSSGVHIGSKREVDGSFTSPHGPPLISIPRHISKLQLVRALRSAGHWGGVKAALAQADTDTKEDWEFAYRINRDDPLMETFSVSLGLTPADMDTLFMAGITL